MFPSERLKAYLTTSFLILALYANGVEASPTDPFQPSISADQVEIVQDARTDRLNGDANSAIAKLLPIVKKNPQYYSALYGLALSYARLGDESRAISYLKRAEGIRDYENIKDVTIFNTLGWLYLRSSDYDNAEAYLKKAASDEEINSRETNGRIFNNLGLLYLTIGQFAQSEKAFQKAMQFGSPETANLKLLDEAENNSKARTTLSSTALVAAKAASPGRIVARPLTIVSTSLTSRLTLGAVATTQPLEVGKPKVEPVLSNSPNYAGSDVTCPPHSPRGTRCRLEVVRDSISVLSSDWKVENCWMQQGSMVQLNDDGTLSFRLLVLTEHTPLPVLRDRWQQWWINGGETSVVTLSPGLREKGRSWPHHSQEYTFWPGTTAFVKGTAAIPSFIWSARCKTSLPSTRNVGGETAVK